MFMTYGDATNVAEICERRLLPEGLVKGCKLFRDVAKEAVQTYDDVEFPLGRIADQLRAEQYRHFRGESWLEELFDRGRQRDCADHRRLLNLSEGDFRLLNEGKDLVMDVCMGAAKAGRAGAAQYDGFSAPRTRSRSPARWRTKYRRRNNSWALWREGPVDLVRLVTLSKRLTR
jgi:hypothetical protein